MFKTEFEEYAKKNHLNITLQLETIIFTNPTDSYEYYKSLVETSLRKSVNNDKNNKIDIYFYDLKFTNLYGSYLLDLKDEFPKAYIEMYDPKIIEETCTYKEKLVGLVIFINKEFITTLIIFFK